MEKFKQIVTQIADTVDLVAVTGFRALSLTAGLIATVALFTVAVKWGLGQLVLDWGVFTD